MGRSLRAQNRPTIMDELPIELHVITLNCWGRRYTSSYREERLTAIGRYLATTEPVPHVVALQECFEYDDYLSIRRETRFALPFGKFYYSGAFSCGLVILSRWPIEETSSMQPPMSPSRVKALQGAGVLVRARVSLRIAKLSIETRWDNC